MVAGALAGCGGADSPSATVTETVTSGPPAATSSAETAAAPTGSLPVSSEPSDVSALTVTDIRVGAHDTFDRVVVEFGGSGVPGYDIRFTDDPRKDGSGTPVTIPGRSVIQVVINGVGYPFDTGVAEFDGPNPVPGAGSITEVAWGGVFEGQSRLFVGADAAEPAVRVSTLQSPTRLVLDVGR